MAYGNELIFGSAALGGNTLILKQWSPDVLRYGRDALVFANYLETRVELGRGKGDTIYVPIMGEMTTLGTTALVEGTNITIGTQTQDSVSITITEYANALGRPSAVDYFSNIALQEQLKQSLAWNWAKTWDAMCISGVYNACQWGARTVAAGSITFGSNLTSAAGTGVGSLGEDNIDEIYDYLRIRKVPKFPDGYYRWITNPVGARDIKKASNFVSTQIYSNFIAPTGLLAQEIGRYKGFVFIETQENLSTTAKLAYAFGMGIGAQAFGLPVEVRAEIDYHQDFGRMNAFAWYTIGGVGMALANKGTHMVVVRHGT